MTTAFLIVRRNVELKDVPLEHTIIGTTEVIGIAVTEAERDTALQENRGAHALEMKRVGASDGLLDVQQIITHASSTVICGMIESIDARAEAERTTRTFNVLDEATDKATIAAGDALAFKPTNLLEEEDA